MHELSLALSMLDMAQEESDRRGGVKVLAVHLKVGRLAGVVPEALLSAFELAAENTPLAGSRLIIEEVPITVYCPRCEQPRTLPSMQWFCCPECDAPTAEVLKGRELEVTALEIEP
jgi:hydrogenase nickel incorporation protein HypA/HybF